MIDTNHRKAKNEDGAGTFRRASGRSATSAASRSMWKMCNNLYVCPKCGGYFRVHAYRRIEMLLDEGSFEEWNKEMEFFQSVGFPGL